MSLGKRIALVVGVVLGVLVAAYVAAEVWAGWQIGAYRAVLVKDLAEERLRLEAYEPPRLPGEAIPGNAAPQYEHVWQQSREWPLSPAVNRQMPLAVTARPGTPLPAEVRGLLRTHARALEQVRRATHYSRCDWSLEYEKGMSGKLPPHMDGQLLGILLLLTGHERAAAGDLGGAALRYLETMRYWHDFSLYPTYVATTRAASMQRLAAAALGELVAGQARGAPYLPPGLPERMGDLGRLVPSPAWATARERLFNGYWFVNHASSLSPLLPFGLDTSLSRKGKGILGVLPLRVLFAHGIWQVDVLSREIELAAALSNPQAREQAMAELRKRARDLSWNPLVIVGLKHAGAHRAIDLATAEFRLAWAAMTVERRAAAGRYPAAVPGLPPDPFAPDGLLRYKPLGAGTGYRLWSIGIDGKDNGGVEVLRKPDAELVLERKP